MSILQKTSNFFHLYRHICGKSEVPEIYNFWSAVSLISAAVEDRVWFSKFKHAKLYPNLFVLLVGPSGLGKGLALDQINHLADNSLSIHKFRGRLTYARLLDILGRNEMTEDGITVIANPRIWIVMDELQNDLGANRKLIEEFVYLMTELYTASNYTIDEGTRSHGHIRIKSPIVNWLAGTNEDDLREIVTARLMRSGFTARTCIIYGDYDFNCRVTRVKYPDDYEEVFHHLQCRLWLLQQTCGQFMITPTAEAELDKWYLKRPNPDEELLFAAWKRHHDFMLKFGMILCLADGGPLVLRHAHIVHAKQMVQKIFQFSEKLMLNASETIATGPSNSVARYIKKRGVVGHSNSLRYFRTARGMDAEQFRKAINALVNEGCVEMGRTSTGAIQYRWVDFKDR